MIPAKHDATGNDDVSSNTISTSQQDTGNKASNYIVQVDDVPPETASRDAIHTSSKKTSVVPSGTKTYVVGLRSTADGKNFCSASLITPIHILTGTYCALDNVRWASIGSHYVSGTQDGEQIKVVAILNHPKSSRADFSFDFTILVLEKPSTFQPVALANSDDSDVKDGEWAIKMGWDDTGGANTLTNELMRADVQLMSNSDCMKQANITETMLCSRGNVNETSCTGDYGGPVIVKRSSRDVVVGLVSWGDDCDKPDYPSIYSRVSSVRAWINSVINGVCFH
ncbi:unnamed protein product [Peronospora belbahrii]|uniref:Peptidase S1 domain-containing protein n=1 Tax=Peronospora belbahrii TaxID=622444 RepID=A0ABN8D8Z2_9STRA|nr:unnamed protein product [Peronospora belbahrii]